jgi:maltooligosyltrehalose trehalohydrolase
MHVLCQFLKMAMESGGVGTSVAIWRQTSKGCLNVTTAFRGVKSEAKTDPPARRFPFGAEPASNGISFRIWAPGHETVLIEFEEDRRPPLMLAREANGFFTGASREARVGDLYWVRLGNQKRLLPDLASRYQPDGPEGASAIVDPKAFGWTDDNWQGSSLDGLVVYELHIGTFTRDGTWAAATEQLGELAKLGVTAVEVMPVHEFPGEFGWSYDAANLFAPSHLYGEPDDFRRFVDAAHREGIGVLLDVVFNHFGRVGEELIRPFSEIFFSRRHKNEWGSAINFDDEGSGPVREFFLANIRMWIDEYHLDGVRIDATQAFHDDSPTHILLDLARAARAAAGSRHVIVAGESEPQVAKLMRPESDGGYEFDACWNDDFHHSAMVRLTGCAEAYYSDYRGTTEEFLASARWGYLYQGQRYAWQDHGRGSPALDLPAVSFINYLQNHDQIANSPRGERLHQRTSPGRLRAMTALWLLMPQTPLFFQGQEFAASNPFVYFNDAGDDAETVTKGRAKFLSQFRSYATDEIQSLLPDPAARDAFERSKLDLSERDWHAGAYVLHRDLLRLRTELRPWTEHRIEGATLGLDALLLRFRFLQPDSHLLIVNFGVELKLESVPQPLIAPPTGRQWQMVWSSEDPQYGGRGMAEPETPQGWRLPGESAVLLAAKPISEIENR